MPPRLEIKPIRWHVFRMLLLLSSVVSYLAVFQLVVLAYGSGPWLGHFSKRELLKTAPVLVWGCLALGIAIFAWDRLAPVGLRLKQIARDPAAYSPLTGWLLVGLSWLMMLIIIALPIGQRLARLFPLFWIFTHLALLGALGLFAALRSKPYLICLAIIFMAYGAALEIVGFLPDISTNPFTLGWSEGSRFFNASLFFARKIYGSPAPLPTLHPSRYLLQSIPFLISSLPLWVHRLWQVILWLGGAWAGAALLTRRLGITSRLVRWLLTAWSFLFLFQGPVYYHLMVGAILVLWGFDGRKFWRSLAVVVLASLWAGISRINWFPVPGMLAALLYVLEIRQGDQPFWRYLLPPSIWIGVGLAAAFISQAIYIPLSGNDQSLFGSSFTSNLLWYRLFPSATYPAGILLGIFWAALPLVIAVLVKFTPSLSAWKPIRWLVAAGMLAVLFAGGMVVSVKIGGGSNLHNLDAFLVLLLVTGIYALFGSIPPDQPEKFRTVSLPWWLLGLIIFIPVVQAIPAELNFSRIDQQSLQKDVSTIQTLIDQNKSGEILFIDNRQLLTFNYVNGVELVPEYEKVFLMEMAMANNQGYLQKFENDLRSHRFSLIISEVLNPVLQNSSHNFGEENNAWVEHVSIPILNYYQEKMRLQDVGVEILVPKQ